MIKQKIEIPVGRKVRGYGLLNEYGEFEFTPEQTGIKAGAVKVVKQAENYTVSNSKNCLIVHINVRKGEKMAMMKSLMQTVATILEVIRTYNF